MYDLVLLVGGTGSRMQDKPNGNKHLVKIGNKTIIEHIKDKIDTYEKAVQPFENKYVVTNGIGVDTIMSILGQDYKYFYQAQPTGVPDAAFLPKPKNPFLLHLGDQFYTEPIGKFIQGFDTSKEDMRVWLYSTTDTNHTVALLDENWIKRFVEKPNYGHNISGLVATGMYMLSPRLSKIAEKLPHYNKNVHASYEGVGESNMSDLGNQLLSLDAKVGKMLMQGKWYDVGNQEIRREAEQCYK